MIAQLIIELVKTQPDDQTDHELLRQITKMIDTYACKNLTDLRKRNLYLLGLRCSNLLLDPDPPAASLNFAMKWIDQSEAATPTEEDGLAEQIEQTKRLLKERGQTALEPVDPNEDDPTTR